MRGQFSLTNIIGLFMGLIVLLLVAFPILSPLIENEVTNINAHPNAYTPIEVALLYLIPTFLVLGVIVTIFRYATGNQPPGLYGPR